MKTLYSFSGNICSGKTSVAKILSEKHQIKCYSIDEYRIKYNATNFHREWQTWEKLQSDIIKEDKAILESSGLSENLTDIYKKFDKVIVILLKCPENILIKRAKERMNEVPFYLASGKKPVECQIIEMEFRLRSVVYNYAYNTGNSSPGEIAEQISNDIFPKPEA